jgi:hypothetical protein
LCSSQPGSWGEHEAAAQEIEVRAAEHLPLEHFQAIDLTLHWPVTPAERDPSWDRGIIVPKPFGKPLEGVQGTLAGAHQPGIELRRLVQAYKLGKVLGQVNCLSQLSLL